MREMIERYLDSATDKELRVILWFIRGLKKD